MPFLGTKMVIFRKMQELPETLRNAIIFKNVVFCIYCLNQCLDILLYVVICYIFGQSSSYLIQAEVPLPKMAVPTSICLIKSTSNYLGIS